MGVGREGGEGGIGQWSGTERRDPGLGPGDRLDSPGRGHRVQVTLSRGRRRWRNARGKGTKH